MAARAGAALVAGGCDLVYGGGRIGLMGVLADAVLAAGGRVTGVIPQSLARAELAHPGITELVVVASMHERKARMTELSDGFIALPGGFGTMDEFFEALTWRQLGLHDKPVGLLDAAGFFTPLLRLFDDMLEAGFISSANRALVVSASEMPALLARMFPDLSASAPGCD